MLMTEHAKQIHIVIDGHEFDSAEQTTGAALYRLGKVRPDYDLFREVRGHGDDELIANSAAPITVRNGDQFYSAKRTLNPGA